MTVFLIIVCVLVLLAALFLYMIAPKKATAERLKPYLHTYVCHRGYFSLDQSIPENSLPAFQKAVEHGFGVELDVQLTRDKQLVVFHDDTLKRACGVDARVDSWSYQELCDKLRLFGTEEKIPLFSEVLAVLDGKVPVIVELKSGGDIKTNCEKTLAMLRDYHGEFCVESFDPRIVRFFYKNAPDIMRGQLSERYKANRTYLGVVPAFMLANVMTNHYTHPQFIAYDGNPALGKKPWPVRLSERMGAFRVMWTDKPGYDQDELKKQYDCLIFQHFDPPVHY